MTFSSPVATGGLMLKILQARLQQYMNCELPYVQAGFRKGRGTRDQIADIHWIIEKRDFQKKIYSCFIDYTKVLTMLITTNSGKFFKRWEYQTPDLPPEKPVCRSRSYSYKWMWKNRLVPNRKRSTSRLYIVTLLV